MSLPKHLRRYGLFGFLCSLCLTAVLFSGLPAGSQLAPPWTAAQNTPPPAEAVSPSLSLTQNVRKTVLDNGLTVLTKEVNTVPVVTVQVWYRVGSRNETPGINGIAHQLEHLMFKGTKERPIQFGQFFSVLGSDSNAFTSYDQTAYFGTVEQDKLKALLVLEADRMKNSIIGEKELASEKRVVISELQGYENSPGYRLGRAVMKAAFPNSPYGLPVGGTKADVERFTVQQVRDYYQSYYRPDNATLIIVGNFQTEPTLNLVKETFGKLPRETQPLPAENPSQLASDSGSAKPPIVLREPGSAAILNEIYPLPNATHPDVPVLQIMDYILAGGRSSRLYQALVETGLASSADGYAANMIGGGWYEFSITAAPGKDLKQIDQVLQKTLADLRDRGVSQEELERAKTQYRASMLLRNRDIVSQAFQLGDDQTTTGDYRFTDRLLNAISKVTAADVQRAAQTYLAPNKRTVGFFEPTRPNGQGASAGNFAQTTENFSPGEPVDPAEVAKYLPPLATNGNHSEQPLPEKLTLANGLQVLLLPDRSTPTVTLSGFIEAGSTFDQPATAGLASLTAANLMNGTKTRDALAIAKTLENRGASLSFSAGREGVRVSGSALASDLPVLTQVLADVLKNASFPEKELELSRQRALTALKLELDNPARLARRVFQQTVYPENHPFHTFPTEASLNAITRDDVVRFYRDHYHPDSTVLTLLGDFDPAQVRSLLNRELGTWEDPTNDTKLTFPDVPLPQTVVRKAPALPGKTQSVTFLGYNAITRKDPRYYAALVMNQILGGDTLSSRLGTEIRDRQGLTYGIYSFFQAGKNAGPFLITLQTAPEDTERAIASTLGLLKQVHEKGVTGAEVAAAKRSLTSSYSVELADPDDLASLILMNAVFGLDINEIRNYTDKIEAVTPAQVNQVIAELLHPDRIVIVTAGPPSSTIK
ncbi:M16 family metallopeptidase [Leptothermofonsia sp. ETS-13]|uniref:M16 family metallopeptidase n=1 Tax=Leptothermofonsia sp. ETS-13 TaxID=3035696 RepID=UPI003BA195B2